MAEVPVILVVEDREDDIYLIKSGLNKAGILCPVQVVRDGEEAISYLKGEGRFANRDEYPLPDLVLLDLKLPGTDGFDVLKWIRTHPGMRGLRVVVLTSSDEMRDVNAAYQIGANSFLVKPADFMNYIQLGRNISQYWLGADRAPESSRGSWPSEDRENREKQ